MMKYVRYLSVLALVLLVFAPMTSVLAGGKPLHVTMDWRNVVPEGSGDPNVFGHADIYVNSGQGELCYETRLFFYFDSPTGATINRGVAGENGPVVVDVGAPIAPPRSTTATGCVSVSRSLLQEIHRNPTNFYYQVTDESHPDGATRGQLGS